MEEHEKRHVFHSRKKFSERVIFFVNMDLLVESTCYDVTDSFGLVDNKSFKSNVAFNYLKIEIDHCVQATWYKAILSNLINISYSLVIGNVIRFGIIVWFMVQGVFKYEAERYVNFSE